MVLASPGGTISPTKCLQDAGKQDMAPSAVFVQAPCCFARGKGHQAKLVVKTLHKQAWTGSTTGQGRSVSALRSNLRPSLSADKAEDSPGSWLSGCNLLRLARRGCRPVAGSADLDSAPALPQPPRTTLGQLLRFPPALVPICSETAGYVRGFL